MARLRQQNGRRDPWKVKYFGVGNENWGCGGNLRADEYAREYRRYQTYLASTPENRLYKIACGPAEGDLAWMETLLQQAASLMDGISVHHYALGGPDWGHKGSALRFGIDDWYVVLSRALQMDGILTGHERLLDRFDPKGRIGLVVDEWGTWYDAEPGTDPAYLYQQNTMRDALVAAVTLNIFNHHSARVVMANLAQLVNVLQAPILTNGPRMVTTPTYHVFDLYQAHQGGTLVDTFLEAGEIGPETGRVPDLHESASRGPDGSLTITVVNLCHDKERTLEALVVGQPVGRISARVLRGAPNEHNTFEAPRAVEPHPHEDLRRTDQGFTALLPPASVVAITVAPAGAS